MGPIIAGALAGGGEAGERVGLQAQKQLGEQDLIKMRAEAEQELAKTAATLAQQTHSVNTNTDIAAIPKRMSAETEGLKTRETELRPGRVAERKEFAAVDSQAAVDLFEKLDPLKRKSELTSALEKLRAMTTPEMLEATKKLTLAQVTPQFTLTPGEDGTVTLVDVHTGKSGGSLKGDDNKPLKVRDPSQVTAASSVINMANTNLRIAQAEHKSVIGNAAATDEEKAKANAEWTAAQEEAKRLTMPAYAVLYGRARAEGDLPVQPPAATHVVTARTIPPAAVEELRKNPSLAKDFDSHYGAGESAKVLKKNPLLKTGIITQAVPDEGEAE